MMKFVMGLLFLSAMNIMEATQGYQYDKMKMTDVKALTLKAGQLTTGRRLSPIPQLECVGGNGAGYGYEPSIVQCYNMGTDGKDVQWQCNAELDTRVKFGRMEVLCEGYDYPEDEIILSGSCGLRYELDLTNHGIQNPHKSSASVDNSKNRVNEKDDLSRFIIYIAVIFTLVMIVVIVKCLEKMEEDAATEQSKGSNKSQKEKDNLNININVQNKASRGSSPTMKTGFSGSRMATGFRFATTKRRSPSPPSRDPSPPVTRMATGFATTKRRSPSPPSIDPSPFLRMAFGFATTKPESRKATGFAVSNRR